MRILTVLLAGLLLGGQTRANDDPRPSAPLPKANSEAPTGYDYRAYIQGPPKSAGAESWKVNMLHDPLWLGGEATIITTWTLDATSTIYGAQRCPGCTDRIGNPHNTGKVVGLDLLGIGAETVFHVAGYYVLRHDNRFWRFLSKTAIPAENAAIVLPGVVNNYRRR